MQTVEEEAGECTLLRRSNPQCDPACNSGETCDFDGACIPYPEQQDVGTITVTGLAEPVSLEALAPTNSYFDSTVAHPAFSPGDPIHVITTDGYFGVIDLYGVGVEPLVATGLTWTLSAEEPLSITWPAPEEDTGSRMKLLLNIDQHGSSPLTLSCDFPDTGEAQVPAALIDALLDAGASGMPNGRLTRRTVDSMDVEGGCVELLVTSALQVDVTQVE